MVKELLKSQRNEVYRLIEEAGMEPREFEWDQFQFELDPGGFYEMYVPGIRHRPTAYSFAFGDNSVAYDPGSESQQDSVNTRSWLDQLRAVERWLEYAKREIDAPSLWEDLALGEPMLDVPMLADAQDTPFAPDEAAAIRDSIGEVMRYLRSELPAASIPLIEGRLLAIEAKLDDTGRVTWMQLIIGFAMAAAWSGVMDPVQARHVLDIIGKAFQHLLGTGG